MNRHAEVAQRLSILTAMVKHGGNQGKAANELGIHRVTINKLLGQYARVDEVEVDAVMGRDWTGKE